MTIRMKLLASFTLLALTVLLVAGLALTALSNTNEGLRHVDSGFKARGDVADKVRHAVDERAIAVRNLVLLTKPAEVNVEKALLSDAQKRIVQGMAQLKAMVAGSTDVTPKGLELIGEMDKIEAEYTTVALAIVDLALNGKRDEAVTKINEECRPLLTALVKVTAEYDTVVDARWQRLLEEQKSSYAWWRTVLIAVGALAAAFAAAAAILVTRGIIRPLSEAVELAQSVAEGDLSARVIAGDQDEVGKLLDTLGRMSGNLEGIVARVRQSSDCIATGSAQIASGNADLSHRTETQASALQQTAATMERLGLTVRHNAESAEQANQLAAGASAVAARGGEVVVRVVATMQGITESSRRIGDIISVIDGIAFQTNVLALNAAVEAARAGEHGRGFAVVASEVRGLAQRSAGAAKEIKSLIANSVEQVEQGTTLVAQAGMTMGEIVDAIRRVTDVVAEIAAASAEQRTGVAEVGEAVRQIDHATQQNAALVEESAAAAESLKDQAEQLVQAVAVFKLSAVAA